MKINEKIILCDSLKKVEKHKDINPADRSLINMLIPRLESHIKKHGQVKLEDDKQ